MTLSYEVIDGNGGSIAATQSFSLAAVIDTVSSNNTTTLSTYVENLQLTGSANINGTGNAVDNLITGNSRNNILNGMTGADTLIGLGGTDTLNGGDGADSLNGGEGADILVGGAGKDNYNLSETVQTIDIVRIAASDSTVALFDVATGFRLGTGNSSAGVDKLDLVSTTIASNGTGNGTDVGIGADAISSHSISNGIIRFDSSGSYNSPVTVTASNLANVLTYLQAQITNGNTVAFNTADTHDTYVFQGDLPIYWHN